MGKRTIQDRGDVNFNLAGDLKHALHRHTRERAEHFFSFLFILRALVNHVNRVGGLRLAPADAVQEAATEQIDTGFRSKRFKSGTDPDGYNPFEKEDDDVVTLQSTAFGSTDAAHFCNLGIKPAFVSAISPYITQTYYRTDPMPFDLYERLKVIAGNTQWLPQRVNIGPDRVIDQMHGDLAIDLLRATPAQFSAAQIVTYRDTAIALMSDYRTRVVGNGEEGLAACADCYLEIYQDALVVPEVVRRKVRVQRARDIQNLPPHATPPVPLAPPVLPFVDTVYGSVAPEIRGFCAQFRNLFAVGDYLI